jgi:hypothetical protein
MMISSAAAVGLFRSMPKKPARALEIPIVVCPVCEKRQPMTIKSISPHLRTRDGVDVEFSCATCGALERKNVKPA